MRYGTGMVLVLTAGLLWSLQALIIRQMDDAESWAILFNAYAGIRRLAMA